MVPIRLSYSTCIWISWVYWCLIGTCSGQTIPHYWINTSNGLPSNEVYHLQEDQQGFIWICTDHGVVRYDGQNFRQFTTLDGLLSNTIFEAINDPKGRVWFRGFKNGFCYYEQDSIYQFPLNNKIEQLTNEKSAIPSLVVDSSDQLWFSLGYFADSFHIPYYNIPATWDTILTKKSDLPQFSSKHPDTSIQRFVFITPSTYVSLGGYFYYISFFFSPYKFEFEYQYKGNSTGIGLMGSFKLLICNDREHIYYTNKHIYKINPQTHQVLEQFSLSPEDGSVINMYLDAQNRLWLATTKGAYYFKNSDLSNKPTTIFTDYNITNILCSKDGTIWLATYENGVLVIPNVNARFYPLAHKTSNTSKVIKFLSHQQQHYAITSDERLYQLEDLETPLYQGSNRFLFAGVLLDSNTFLSASGNQVALQNGAVIDYFPIMQYQKTSIKAMLQTQSGELWLGLSYDLALWQNGFHLQRLNQRFNCLLEHPSRPNCLVLGGLEGGFIYNTSTKEMEALGDAYPLLKRRITCVASDSKGNLFFGTRGSGLLILRTDQTLVHLTPKDGLISPFISCLALANDSTLWLGGNWGCNKLLLGAQHSVQQTISFPAQALVPNASVNDFLLTDSCTWVATSRGLVALTANPKTPEQVLPPIPLHLLRATANQQSFQSGATLPYDQNQLSFLLAGIHFQIPNLQYEYRLLGASPQWQRTNKTTISYANVPPGKYQLELRMASFYHPQPATVLHFPFIIQPHFSQTWWFGTMIGLIGLLIIGSLIFARFRTIQLAQQKTLAEQKALHSQMKPHFIFNALNSILYFVERQQSEQASQYLIKFSKLLRRILENAQSDLVLLSKELEAIQAYFNLEQLRLTSQNPANEQVFTIDPIPDTCANCKIPAMLLQPLVENAVLHGLTLKKGVQKIHISLQATNKQLIISIEDNGIGRSAAAKINTRRKHHQSLGLSNVQQRLKTLQKIHKKPFSMEIVDLEEGTLVHIFIPKLV